MVLVVVFLSKRFPYRGNRKVTEQGNNSVYIADISQWFDVSYASVRWLSMGAGPTVMVIRS